MLTKLQEIDLQSHSQLTESPPAAVHDEQWLIEICFTEETFSLKVNEHCLWAPMLSVPVLEIWKTPLVTFVTLQARASGAVALVVAETGEIALFVVAEAAQTATITSEVRMNMVVMVMGELESLDTKNSSRYRVGFFNNHYSKLKLLGSLSAYLKKRFHGISRRPRQVSLLHLSLLRTDV